MTDEETIEQFRNFLSWDMVPQKAGGTVAVVARREIPPAVYAYVLGATPWCPPKGEL